MAQKGNLTLVDKYESDRGEAERLDLEKRARLEASEPMSALQPAPTAEHQRREGLSFWQAVQDHVQLDVGNSAGGMASARGGFASFAKPWGDLQSYSIAAPSSLAALRRMVRSYFRSTIRGES